MRNLPPSNLDGGAGAASNSFWRGWTLGAPAGVGVLLDRAVCGRHLRCIMGERIDIEAELWDGIGDGGAGRFRLLR